ncbi:hypothetical protein NI470_07895 [Acinetobacter lwoffii]|uniref:hypothetical protein n=1 Tax=Acinetobacter lwoffii TaxID=28090 RepID=UPI00209B77A9|nr:hypothetical protein [Acinetobacter lwoffii]MCO8073652.1 hypothetical protein [Acinetobacter lwoffii]MCO8076522.1 hypothetical protein [Acinetobacter lwoffii]
MSNSPSQFPISTHPVIQSLNVRNISKMIASKIIEHTALQLHFNSSFCNQLSVADHLNTYEAVTYFIDNQFFERYGFNRSGLINFHEVYDEFWAEFSCRVNYQTSI